MMIDLILELDPERSFLAVRSPESSPGSTLWNLRVVISDHNVELTATDKVMFVVQ